MLTIESQETIRLSDGARKRGFKVFDNIEQVNIDFGDKLPDSISDILAVVSTNETACAMLEMNDRYLINGMAVTKEQARNMLIESLSIGE